MGFRQIKTAPNHSCLKFQNSKNKVRYAHANTWMLKKMLFLNLFDQHDYDVHRRKNILILQDLS